MSFDAASQKVFFAIAGDLSSTPCEVLGTHGTGPIINAITKDSKNLLKNLSRNSKISFRDSYSQGDLIYHVKQTSPFAYICVSGKKCKKRIVSAFLGLLFNCLKVKLLY